MRPQPVDQMTLVVPGFCLDVASSRWGKSFDRDDGNPYAFGATANGGFVACLCDGTGDWGEGLPASRVAARAAVDTYVDHRGDPSEAMGDGLAAAHEKVRTYSDDELGAACSATIVTVHDGVLRVAWIGGVDLLVIRDGKLALRTTPHLLEKQLLAEGKLAEKDVAGFPLKGIVLRCLASSTTDEDIRAQIEELGPLPVDDGDRVLLCSREVLDACELSEIESTQAMDLEGTVNTLLERGARDHFEACVIAIHVRQQP